MTSYEEYLAGVAKQRERDQDRFYGRDSHPDEPAYDPETGKKINPVRPRLVIELDENLLPVVVDIKSNGDADLMALREAATYGTAYSIIWGKDSLAETRRMMEAVQKGRAEVERQIKAWNAERPWACGCGMRYKTKRRLTQHQARKHPNVAR